MEFHGDGVSSSRSNVGLVRISCRQSRGTTGQHVARPAGAVTNRMCCA